MYASIPHGLPVVAVLVAERLPDVFNGLDVVDALTALRRAEAAAGGETYDEVTAASVIGALTAHELASVMDDGPPAVYRIHRDALPM